MDQISINAHTVVSSEARPEGLEGSSLSIIRHLTLLTSGQPSLGHEVTDVRLGVV